MKTGATELLLSMKVGDWAFIGSEYKVRQSYLQIASRLKRLGKGRWAMMKQPGASVTGNATFAIRREE